MAPHVERLVFLSTLCMRVCVFAEPLSCCVWKKEREGDQQTASKSGCCCSNESSAYRMRTLVLPTPASPTSRIRITLLCHAQKKTPHKENAKHLRERRDEDTERVGGTDMGSMALYKGGGGRGAKDEEKEEKSKKNRNERKKAVRQKRKKRKGKQSRHTHKAGNINNFWAKKERAKKEKRESGIVMGRPRARRGGRRACAQAWRRTGVLRGPVPSSVPRAPRAPRRGQRMWAGCPWQGWRPMLCGHE